MHAPIAASSCACRPKPPGSYWTARASPAYKRAPVRSRRISSARRAGPLPRLAAPPALKAVQDRRDFPTRVTQRVQVLVQNRILSRVLAADADAVRPPLMFSLLARFAFLRRIPARIVGIGVRPEHVHSPAGAALDGLLLLKAAPQRARPK